MAKKSVIEKALSTVGEIDKRYSLRADELEELRDKSGSMFLVIANSFRYGYLQGTRAAKAEMKESK